MPDKLQIPPIRTGLLDNTADNAANKPWYLFWNGVSDQVNAGADAIAEGAARIAALEDFIVYGLHDERLDADAATMLPGTLWVETDRPHVLYQLQDDWHYIGGTMYGTFVPDERPTDLGANDAGFDFRTTDLPAREFIWSGTVWAEVTAAGNTIQVAYGTTGLTLTTATQNVPGCSLTLAKAGQYLIAGVFDFAAADAGVFLIGGLSGQTPAAIFMTPATSGRVSVTQQWVVSASAGSVVQLTASKTGGTGTSGTGGIHTSITAMWVSP